jgi:hypothetical protein
MFEREITQDEVKQALSKGEIIEEYLNDVPYPSFLALGLIGDRVLHAVAAFNKDLNQMIVITVYEPDLSKWKSGFRERIK